MTHLSIQVSARIRGRARIAAACLVTVMMSGLLVATGGAAAAEDVLDPARRSSPTPELLERAVEQGELTQEKADLYLAYALTEPNMVPSAYRSTGRWSATMPLLRLYHSMEESPHSPAAQHMSTYNSPGEVGCGGSTGPLPNTHTTTRFHIQYDANASMGGLTITEFGDALEQAWQTEINSFGWAAPPVLSGSAPPGNRYHVRLDELPAGTGGYVTNQGQHAGLVGDNPSTSWDDLDAMASCMVMNRDFGYSTTNNRRVLRTVAAHELVHAIQFGLGILSWPNIPSDVIIEGGANWMVEEVFDDANIVHLQLWPDFTLSHLGEPGEEGATQDPYNYWIFFRALTERYGTKDAGEGERVMQAMWEELSKTDSADARAALDKALVAEGTTLASAFHAYAVAVRFSRPCGGGYVYPYCFIEGTAYKNASGTPSTMGSVPAVGATFSGSVRDYALSWVSLPTTGSPYKVTLRNDSFGGSLRTSVSCDTGSQIRVEALSSPAVVGGGESQTLSTFDTSGCSGSIYAVVTNHTTPGDTVQERPFTLAVSSTTATAPGVPTEVSATAGNASATVTWTQPSNGGSPITGYVIHPYANGTDPIDPIYVDSPVTSKQIRWLTNGIAYKFRVAATNAIGTSNQSSASNSVTPNPSLPPFDPTGRYVPLDVPLRVLDTRDGTGTNGTTAPIAQQAALPLQITRRDGMPAEAEAVVLNVTVTEPSTSGYLTVYPRGIDTPLASNLNFTAGRTVPNLVEVPVGYAGWVSVYNAFGSTHVVADVQGYVETASEGSPRTDGGYRPLTPTRLFDTRDGSGLSDAGPLPPDANLDVAIAGRAGVPAQGAAAVVLNVTVTEPTTGGYVTVYPTPQDPFAPVPLASNLNFVSGQTVPNRVMVRLGYEGWVSFFNKFGDTHLVVDVAGWFTDGSQTESSSGHFHGLSPTRITDTRPGSGEANAGSTLGSEDVLTVQVAGVGGVPAMSAPLPPTAVVMNVTVDRTGQSSFLTVYPSTGSRPVASDLNWVAGLTVPNLVVATLGTDGKVKLFNLSGSVDVIIDVVGWYS